MAKRKAGVFEEPPNAARKTHSVAYVEIDTETLRRVTRSTTTPGISTPRTVRTYGRAKRNAPAIEIESTTSLKENGGVKSSQKSDISKGKSVDIESEDELMLLPRTEPLQPASPTTTRTNNKRRKLEHHDLEIDAPLIVTPISKGRKPKAKVKLIQDDEADADREDEEQTATTPTVRTQRSRAGAKSSKTTPGQPKKRGRPAYKQAQGTSHPPQQPSASPSKRVSRVIKAPTLEINLEGEDASSASDVPAPPSPLKGRGGPAQTKGSKTAGRSPKRVRSQSPVDVPMLDVESLKKRKASVDLARVPSTSPTTKIRAVSPLFSELDPEEWHQPEAQDNIEGHDGDELVADPPASPSKQRLVASRAKTAQPSKQQPRRSIRTADIPDIKPRTPNKRKPRVVVSSPVESPSSDHSSDELVVESILTSPLKAKSAEQIPGILLPRLHPCLTAQKRSVLRALQKPPIASLEEEDGEQDNAVAYQQLTDLLDGTMSRNEGNSCLVVGPRGSGKTRLIERCISDLSTKPIIIRLSGWVQSTDRLALKEIAIQLAEQTDGTFLSEFNESNPDVEEPNPFLDDQDQLATVPIISSVSLPPSSHLPALISLLPTLGRPTIVILDAFDLFALHPRQALLYCLLDTVQSCQAGKGNKGLGIIGITGRVDTTQLLEKRVKSRFSGRLIRLTPPQKNHHWLKIVHSIYLSDISQGGDIGDDELNEWKALWVQGVEKFVTDPAVARNLEETFSITRDVRLLSRIMTPPILHLTHVAPFPLARRLISSALVQRARPSFPFLSSLSYPCLCLLIASRHADTSGHPTFTFEMLLETFRNQVRASTSAPVQLNGSSIGMVRCSREVLMSAFESLGSARIFVCVAAPSLTTAKEFVKYRSVVEWADLKSAVEKTGQTNLKKWLNKAQ